MQDEDFKLLFRSFLPFCHREPAVAGVAIQDFYFWIAALRSQ